VDTCGFAAQSTLLEIAPLADLILYDLKCMDDQRHVSHTGVSNREILQNLQALARMHDNIWIRIPLIPGFNDDTPMLTAAAEFVASLPSVRQVNLLPYHRLGNSKSHDGRPDPTIADGYEISQQRLEEASGHFQAVGLTTLIGG
jgi:pyruvate formate lyase activating enzyme